MRSLHARLPAIQHVQADQAAVEATPELPAPEHPASPSHSPSHPAEGAGSDPAQASPGSLEEHQPDADSIGPRSSLEGDNMQASLSSGVPEGFLM